MPAPPDAAAPIGVVADAGQRQIADRNDMRIAVAGAGVSSAIAERIQLLDIAKRRAGLLGDPFAQANFEGAMPDRIETDRREGRRRRPAHPRASSGSSGSSTRTATIAAVSPISTGGETGASASRGPTRRRRIPGRKALPHSSRSRVRSRRSRRTFARSARAFRRRARPAVCSGSRSARRGAVRARSPFRCDAALRHRPRQRPPRAIGSPQRNSE